MQKRLLSKSELEEVLLVTPPLDSLSFKSNGYGRMFASHVPFDESLKVSLFKKFGISAYENEPLFGNFIGINYKPTASVHEHTDPAPKGFIHTRLNIFLKRPQEGGMPVLNGQALEVAEDECWLCLASLQTHSSTPLVKGIRQVLSLGALVKEKLIETRSSL